MAVRHLRGRCWFHERKPPQLAGRAAACLLTSHPMLLLQSLFAGRQLRGRCWLHEGKPAERAGSCAAGLLQKALIAGHAGAVLTLEQHPVPVRQKAVPAHLRNTDFSTGEAQQKSCAIADERPCRSHADHTSHTKSLFVQQEGCTKPLLQWQRR